MWFVKGTPIDLFDGTPTATVTASKSFSITDMSDFNGGNLNSACFIAPDVVTGAGKLKAAGVSAPSASKSLASHIRLAREARELAEKCKK